MTDSTRRHGIVRRWPARLVWSVVLIFATIVIGGALDARRRLPDLEPWHRIVPRDFRAADLTPKSSLADYLAREDAAFRVVHDQIEQRLDPIPVRLHPPQFKRERDVLLYGAPRKQICLLEHHAYARMRPSDLVLAQVDPAATQLVEASNGPEQGCLAAARWSHDGDELAGLDGHVHVL